MDYFKMGVDEIIYFLTAGNSPLGLRLPLESLIVKPPVEIEKMILKLTFLLLPTIWRLF